MLCQVLILGYDGLPSPSKVYGSDGLGSPSYILPTLISSFDKALERMCDAWLARPTPPRTERKNVEQPTSIVTHRGLEVNPKACPAWRPDLCGHAVLARRATGEV